MPSEIPTAPADHAPDLHPRLPVPMLQYERALPNTTAWPNSPEMPGSIPHDIDAQ